MIINGLSVVFALTIADYFLRNQLIVNARIIQFLTTAFDYHSSGQDSRHDGGRVVIRPHRRAYRQGEIRRGAGSHPARRARYHSSPSTKAAGRNKHLRDEAAPPVFPEPYQIPISFGVPSLLRSTPSPSTSTIFPFAHCVPA